MTFTETNINNRTVLARCCFADMVIDMMEARAIGDTDLYECKKRKAMFLNYAIGEMCKYIDEGVFTLNQTTSTEVSCFKDSVAKKFLGQMDALCGCPCGCSGAKILDDNLPKYI